MEWNNTIKVCNQYAQEVIEMYQQKLDSDNKNASFNLRNNLKYDVRVTEDEIKVVLYLEDYYKYVEMGRRPHGKFPPIHKIEEWIEVKPIIPYPTASGKLPTTQQLAFLIGRSIAENGIEPTFYLQTSVEELQDKYTTLLQEAIEEDAINDALIDFDTILLS